MSAWIPPQPKAMFGSSKQSSSCNVCLDLVVERDDGAIIGFEVKAGQRVPSQSFAPLRKLRSAAGDAFVAGIVLCTGTRSDNLEDRLYVMPIDRLWRA